MKHSYIDNYSGINSFFNSLDPRVKIISLFMLLIFIILTRVNAFITYVYYAALIIVLILLSRIPVVFIFKRSLAILPFVLTTVIFIPFLNNNQYACYNGPAFFYNILIKGYLSILCMVLLTASTNFSMLLKAFEILKLPRLIIMVISFMYRYIFVVQDELMIMLQAKESRSACASGLLHFRALANMLGVLFIRTYERSEAVYFAMCARGFNGSIRTSGAIKLGKKDFIFLIIIIVLLFGKILIR